ncbi:hypothetical protein [Streptosporangium sp. NPDC006930]|uniref:hypothetical protein n=1 Tax=Streptosporangium sp. NPDC006930 TaxID=3154783 RepID=UPI00341DCEE3
MSPYSRRTLTEQDPDGFQPALRAIDLAAQRGGRAQHANGEEPQQGKPSEGE